MIKKYEKNMKRINDIIFIFIIVFVMSQGSKIKLVAKGSNSEVYVYSTGADRVVLKMVKLSATKEVNHLLNQSHILKQIEHPNIIKMIKYQEGITMQESSRNVLVLEYAKHGNLLQFIQKNKPTSTQARWICHQLLSSVCFLHCNYFVHRDLKLQNILVCQDNSKIVLKLADFGFSQTTQKDTKIYSKSFKGTKKAYMAPQIHQLLSSSKKQYHMGSADVFALGVIMFAVFLGRFPFEFAKSNDSHYKYIYAGNMEEFWKLHNLSKKESEEGSMVDDFKQLFGAMVDPQPTRRPSLEEVLESGWMKGQWAQMQSI